MLLVVFCVCYLYFLRRLRLAILSPMLHQWWQTTNSTYVQVASRKGGDTLYWVYVRASLPFPNLLFFQRCSQSLTASDRIVIGTTFYERGTPKSLVHRP